MSNEKGYSLKPCPKCGYDYPELISAFSAPESFVRCPRCHYIPEFYSNTDNAIKKWNEIEDLVNEDNDDKTDNKNDNKDSIFRVGYNVYISAPASYLTNNEDYIGRCGQIVDKIRFNPDFKEFKYKVKFVKKYKDDPDCSAWFPESSLSPL